MRIFFCFFSDVFAGLKRGKTFVVRIRDLICVSCFDAINSSFMTTSSSPRHIQLRRGRLLMAWTVNFLPPPANLSAPFDCSLELRSDSEPASDVKAKRRDKRALHFHAVLFLRAYQKSINVTFWSHFADFELFAFRLLHNNRAFLRPSDSSCIIL